MTEDTTQNAETTAVENPAKKPGPPPGTYMRVVKSYVLRAGRTTVAQARAYELYSAHFLLPYAPQPLDIDVAFGRQAPLVMEIGFGMGGATAHIARVRPEDNFLCCEVHELSLIHI